MLSQQINFRTLYSQKAHINFLWIIAKRTVSDVAKRTDSDVAKHTVNNIPERAVKDLPEALQKPEPEERVTPEKFLDVGLAEPFLEFSSNLQQIAIFVQQPTEILIWWKHRQLDKERHRQRFIQERHETLGSDLASAHFLLYRGGKVKFVGQSEWMVQEKGKKCDLPDTFDPNYVLLSIDASKLNLLYEGLDNLRGLTRLKWVSFKGCPNLDDWCVNRISAQFPLLEYLDISDCKNITERGLETLYKMKKLRTLIVTNHNKSAAFELTCMMLQDSNPKLECKIMLPEIATKSEVKQISN